MVRDLIERRIAQSQALTTRDQGKRCSQKDCSLRERLRDRKQNPWHGYMVLCEENPLKMRDFCTDLGLNRKHIAMLMIHFKADASYSSSIRLRTSLQDIPDTFLDSSGMVDAANIVHPEQIILGRP